MTRARRDTGAHCSAAVPAAGSAASSPRRRDAARPVGGTPTLRAEAGVGEHLREAVRPHVLGARAVVVGLGDAGALALVAEVELHLVDAVVEIVEGHELLRRLVVALQIRA